MSLGQRQSYKEDFCAEFDEYKDLHSRIATITHMFVQLGSKIKSLSPGTPEYKVHWPLVNASVSFLPFWMIIIHHTGSFVLFRWWKTKYYNSTTSIKRWVIPIPTHEFSFFLNESIHLWKKTWIKDCSFCIIELLPPVLWPLNVTIIQIVPMALSESSYFFTCLGVMDRWKKFKNWTNEKKFI